MHNFLWLVMAHFIGDWALQGDWIAQNKGKYPIVMFAHSMIWASCICIALGYIGKLGPIDLFFLVLFHYLIDIWKCRTSKTFDSWHLYVDQFLHICQLVVVYFIQ